MEPTLSAVAKAGLENPTYTVQELIDHLESTPEEGLIEWGIIPRLTLARYIRKLEAQASAPRIGRPRSTWKAEAIAAITEVLKGGEMPTGPLLDSVSHILGWGRAWTPYRGGRRDKNRSYLASILQTQMGILWTKRKGGAVGEPGSNMFNVWKLI